MSPLQWAVAISIVSGVAAREGWPHAMGAAAVLMVAIACWRVVFDGPRVRAANASHLVKGRIHRSAEWLITSYAAIFGSEVARDLALETGQALDEMVRDGATRRRVARHVLEFFFNMPVQLPGRATAEPPPVLSTPKPRASRAARASQVRSVFTAGSLRLSFLSSMLSLAGVVIILYELSIDPRADGSVIGFGLAFSGLAVAMAMARLKRSKR